MVALVHSFHRLHSARGFHLVVALLAALLFACGDTSIQPTNERQRAEQNRRKLPAPLVCHLKWKNPPEVGAQNVLLLEIENRFRTGQLTVELNIPQPLRTSQTPQDERVVSLSGESVFKDSITVIIPADANYLIEAKATLQIQGGAEIHASDTIELGPNRRKRLTDEDRLIGEDGQRLRVHRLPPQTRENDR